VQGKLTSRSITRVEYEGWEYTEQEDVERILLPVNNAKVHASENTPFIQQLLVNVFGLLTVA
jgi:hypothetical protein